MCTEGSVKSTSPAIQSNFVFPKNIRKVGEVSGILMLSSSSGQQALKEFHHWKEFGMEQKQSCRTHGRLCAMSQTIHEKCLEEGGAPFFAFYLRPRGCKDRTKEQEDKGLKAEGWRLIPHWQGHFEIKDGRIIPTMGSLTCGVALWGPRSYWPTSMLCVADGRRKGANESSWSQRWNPCSRWRLQQHLCSAQMCQIPSTAAQAHWGRQKINFKDLTRDCVITRSSLLFPGSIRNKNVHFSLILGQQHPS